MSLPILLLSLLIAQQPQAPAPTGNNTATNPDEKKLGKVEGVVINAISKELIRRAEVSLIPMDRPQNMAVMGPGGMPGTRKATSDAEGKFVVTDVEPGRYSIMCQKSGFINGRIGSRGGMFGGGMSSSITVSAGQTVTGVKGEMTPQAIISGRVLDEEGEPLQNIHVQILRSQYMQGRKQMLPMGMGETNDRGEFRIANLQPGQVILSITAPRGPNAPTGSTDQKPSVAYVQTYYPGATEIGQAAKIDVTAGAELSGFDLKLLKGRVTRVRGKLLDASGQPMKNYFLQVMPKSDVFFRGFMSNSFARLPDNSFELGAVQPGSYMLMVQTQPMGSSPPLVYREPLEVGTENIDNLVIRIPAAVKVEGQILVTGTPPENFNRQNVRLQLADESGRSWMPMSQQTVKEDGSFVLENVLPGKYRLNAYGGGDGIYLDSVIYGNQDVTGKDFEIMEAAPVKVMLAVGGGSVTGTVTQDGKPTPGISVLLLSTNSAKRDMPFTKTATTDQNGNYSMKSVAPGDYLVLALSEMEYGFWYEEERLRKVEGKGAKVSVSSSGATSANLTVTPLPD